MSKYKIYSIYVKFNLLNPIYRYENWRRFREFREAIKIKKNFFIFISLILTSIEYVYLESTILYATFNTSLKVRVKLKYDIIY